MKKHNKSNDQYDEEQFTEIKFENSAENIMTNMQKAFSKGIIKKFTPSKKRYISWEEILMKLSKIDTPKRIVYGVPKNGMIVAGYLQNAKITPNIDEADIILDDLVDSGRTMDFYQTKYPNKHFYALFDKQLDNSNDWYIFPWEKEQMDRDNIQDNISRVIQFLGEDQNREGLKDTPDRVAKMYQEIFSGYNQNPEEIFTCFEEESYDQIILLKDIELYSMCEHHMLPFFGKAHIAYIPNGKIVGISKLARLLNIYSKRLQIQERIGEEITSDLMELLDAKGAACIIEATHMCMRMRGVEKQNSIMTTSSMEGVFRDDSTARLELLQLINS